jgi:hypothetical protein
MENNKKQTAVEWLVEQLREYDFSPRDNTYLIEIPSWIWTEKFEQAKEMEKEQIKAAYLRGISNYDPTFKQQEQ